MYSPSRFGHKQIFTPRQITEMLIQLHMTVTRQETFHELSFPVEFYLEKMLRSKTVANLAAPIIEKIFVLVPVRNKMLVTAQKGPLQAR
jgi:hypothetical protein